MMRGLMLGDYAASAIRRGERDLDLDLDRAAARQRGDTDRGATVTAGGAEHLGQQPARAVDDRGLLHETGRGRDESEHRQHAFDAVEAAELGAQHRQARSARTSAPLPRLARP